MVRPRMLIAHVRGVAADPHGRIHVLIAVVFFALAGAVLLIGGVQ